MGGLIMAYSRPLLQAAYEVVQLHPFSIRMKQELDSLQRIEPGTFRSHVYNRILVMINRHICESGIEC